MIEKKKTNADKIRSMTDEELAKMLEWSDLHAVINGDRKLTQKEREEIIERTDYAGEGSYNIDELKEYSDIELAKACISAENDYALSQI